MTRTWEPRAGRARWLLAAVAAGGLALACDRNVEPFDPEAEPREPDLSRIFPPGAGQESPGEVIGGMGASPRGAASPQADPRAAAAAGSAELITGTVTLAGGLSPPEGAILFVIARHAGAVGGPPLAVQRIPGASLPASFRIGPENVMIPSMRFEGEIQLTARLDSDGNAMTRTPGDLQGAAPSPVMPGGQVDILLDEAL